MASRRLQLELKKIQDAGEYDAELVDDNLFKWHLALRGPPGSLYEAGVFLVEITFPASYPIDPPEATFITKIYHPEVSSDGKMCQTSKAWNPRMTVTDIIIPRLVAMLAEPSAESPMNPEAGAAWSQNRRAFTEKVAEWVREHAS